MTFGFVSGPFLPPDEEEGNRLAPFFSLLTYFFFSEGFLIDRR